MNLILIIILIFFLSCDKKSSSYNIEKLEVAEQMETNYFDNEKMLFSLNAVQMKKESQNLDLNFEHNFFCVTKNQLYSDKIYEILDSLFSKLSEPVFTEVFYFSSGVLLDYFENNNELKFNIKSDNAIQYLDKDFIHLKNNVVLSTPNNKSLHTNNLFWDSSSEIVWTYDSIVVKNLDSIQGRGCGLFSIDNLSSFKTFGVKGKVNLED